MNDSKFEEIKNAFFDNFDNFDLIDQTTNFSPGLNTNLM